MNTFISKNPRPRKGLQKFLVFGALAMSASTISFTHAMALDDNALPEGGNVVNGSANFDYAAPNQLDIYQNSDRAVINWNSFNIGANASTRFYQPSSNSVVVNRVTGANDDPSLILGSLRANGKVFVLDRNGVIFGANSTVDVGSIVVGTGTIDDNAFMAGDNVLTIKNINPDSAIVNNGTMTIGEAGLAAFVAPTVINNGIIQARMGRVALASGTKVTVDLYGDKLVEVATDIPLDHASLENNGTINAEGGTVTMTANAAKNIVDNIINMSGTINVSSVTQKGGKIILEGMDTKVSGTMDASGKTGGGTIHVGGAYQGSGTMRHAQNTTVQNTAKIYANTTGTDGNGGEVIIWSDNSTRMDGEIEAKGGTLTGDGGLVETSGKINLGISGSVDASAPNGASGQWLLDPSNVTIHSTAGTNIPVGGGTINPPSDSYVISDSSIEAALNNGNNVTITTTNGGGSETGYIDFDWGGASINKTTGASATLTLKANANINFANSNIRSTGAGNALNVVAWSNFDGAGNDGGIQHYGTILTNGGNIFFVGGLDDGANGGVAGDGIGDNFTGDAVALAGATINAQGGNILINSSDVDNIGLLIQSGTQLKTNGNGNIKIRGIGTSVSFGWAAGILLQSGSSIETQYGAIDITGTNTAATGQGTGLSITGDSTISTTGTTGGNITINATRTGSGNNNATGIAMDGDASRVFTNNGDISITGIGTTSTAGVTGYGFNLTNGADIYSTGNGIVTLTGTGTATTGTAGDFVTSGTGTSEIGKSTSTNSLALNMNTIDLGNTGSALQTQGILTIKPRTAATTIGLGGGTGILNLTDAELGYISAGTLIIGDSAAGTGDVDLDSWNLSAKTHNTEVYGNDIDVGGLTLGTGNFLAYAKKDGGDNGKITISSAITKAIAGISNLTLKSDDDMTIQNITTTIGKLNTIFWTDADNTGNDGRADSGATITTNGGNIYIVGGLDDGANGGIAGDGIGDNYTGNNTIFWNVNYDAGGGDILINSKATTSNGLYIGNGSRLITNGNGNITLRGMAGTGDYNSGIRIESGGGTGNTISAENGTITMDGTNTYSYTGGEGILINGGTVISTNGTTGGNIVFNASRTNGNSWRAVGINILDDTTRVTTNKGNITFNATAHTITDWNGAYSVMLSDGADVYSTLGDTIFNTNSSSTAVNVGDIQDVETTGTGTSNIGNGSSTGKIIFNANTIDLANTGTSVRTSGDIIVKPRTASTTIGLGGASGVLNLTDAELGYFNGTGKLIIGDSVAGTGDMVVDSWNLASKTFNIELYGNDIDLNGLTLGTGDFMAHAKDNGGDLGTLRMFAAATKSLGGNSSLTLRADKDIVFSAGANITASTGSLNVVANADRDADQDGAIFVNANITTNGGYAVFGGGAGTLWGADGIKGTGDDAASTGADKVAAYGNSTYNRGIYFVSNSTNTSAGDLYANGVGHSNGALADLSGIWINVSTLETTSGKIFLTGTAGLGSNGNGGITLQNGSIVRSVTGDIAAKGTSASIVGGWNNYGINMLSSSRFESTGTGVNAAKILLEGYAFSTNGSLFVGDSTVKSVDGDITLKSYAGNSTQLSNITLYNAVVESTGSGNILLESVTGTSNTNAIDFSGGATERIGSATMTGNITIVTNRLDDIETADSIITQGNVIIKGADSSIGIGLGGGSGALNLNDVELGRITANTLIIGDSGSGTGDIDIDTWDLSAKTQNVQLHGKNVNLGGITTGAGNVYLYAKGGSITASANSNSNAAGNITLLSTHNVAINQTLANAGTGKINIFAGWDGTSGITAPALFNPDNINLGVTSRNITIGINGNLSSAGTGTSVLLVAKGAFINNGTAGGTAISAANGRYLVYSDNPTNTLKNGLNAKSLYNKTYAANAPSSITGASRFVYNFQPTTTITANNISAPDTASATYTYSVSGLINGDLAVDALSGSPLYTLGSLTGNTYPIQLAAGTMASPEGYALSYAGGILTIPNNTSSALIGPNSTVNGSILTYTSNVIEITKAEETPKSPNTVSKESEKVGTDINCLVSDASGCVVH